MPTSQAESLYAWVRLGAAVLLSTFGGAGLWSVVVILPAVQAEFGASRGQAAIPYAMTTLGFAVGGVLIGRASDRFGILRPVLFGIAMLAAGFLLSSAAGSLWQFTAAQGVLIGMLGSSATFAPLLADTSMWFTRRRGIAVAVCASGNYLAGTVWPPLIQQAVAAYGWRTTQAGIGLVCLAVMLPLTLLLRRPPPAQGASASAARTGHRPADMGLSPAMLQALLVVAGVACCVAMAMPQVHIVAYCGDLGYGAARGAQMLSLVLGFGVVSRLASGVLADRVGGLPTLLAGSALQALALLLYLGFDGLTPLYVISALFGLFQGGIVPSYAIVIREYFPAEEAGSRIGLVLMATLIGMALGGWMSGAIFDLTGSYRAAFLNGVAWNVLNTAIVMVLALRRFGHRQPALP